MRQTALWHQHSLNTDPARWIMLNVSTSTRTALDRFVASGNSQCCGLALHAHLLAALGRNWTAYIEDLTVALLEQVSGSRSCDLIYYHC